MYAIRNRKTKKWVYGTDYRMHHPRMKKREIGPKFFSYEQRTSFNKALIFGDRKEAELEFDIRGCGYNYEIVEVEIRVKQPEPFFADNVPYYYNSPYKYLSKKEN